MMNRWFEGYVVSICRIQLLWRFIEARIPRWKGEVSWLLLRILKLWKIAITRPTKDLHFIQNAAGAGLAPSDCCICLTGTKTKVLCVEKQQENAQRIGEFLASNPRVKKVNFPKTSRASWTISALLLEFND